MSGSKTALLLIAHGSRRPDANAELERVAEAFRARGRYPIVQVSFLELAEPSIETAYGRYLRSKRVVGPVVGLPAAAQLGLSVMFPGDNGERENGSKLGN